MFKAVKILGLTSFLVGCSSNSIPCDFSVGSTIPQSDGSVDYPECYIIKEGDRVDLEDYNRIKEILGEPCIEKVDEIGAYYQLYYCVENSGSVCLDSCIADCKLWYRIAMLSKRRIVSCEILTEI